MWYPDLAVHMSRLLYTFLLDSSCCFEALGYVCCRLSHHDIYMTQAPHRDDEIIELHNLLLCYEQSTLTRYHQ